MRKAKRVFLLGIFMSITMLAACQNRQETPATPTEQSTATITVALQETLPSEPTATATPQETLTPTPTLTPSLEPTPTETPTPTPTEIPHEHSYEESLILSATCEAEGEKAYTCVCGDSYTEEIPAIGHSYINDDTTKEEATCTKEGKEADRVCTACGDIIAGAKLSKKEHSYGAYAYNNDATQKADGTKTRTCTACGKKDTVTAAGTKLPFDPYSLRAITSLDEIKSVGTMTNEDSSVHSKVWKNIEAGKYEKVRYIAPTGEQFCMWNVRITDERDKDTYGTIRYYWFMAPIEGKFSDGYQHCNLTGGTAKDAEEYMVAIGTKISGSINESMLDRDESIPLAYRVINTKECPVNLYEIVETDTMISVWVESTNCGQEGIGTCGSFDCKKTCLRYTTLEKLRNMSRESGWASWGGGENGRISWNNKLLVNFYYMKY